MSKIAFTVDKKSGHIDTMLMTASRPEEKRFGLFARVVIAVLLVAVAELIYLLAP